MLWSLWDSGGGSGGGGTGLPPLPAAGVDADPRWPWACRQGRPVSVSTCSFSRVSSVPQSSLLEGLQSQASSPAVTSSNLTTFAEMLFPISHVPRNRGQDLNTPSGGDTTPLTTDTKTNKSILLTPKDRCHSGQKEWRQLGCYHERLALRCRHTYVSWKPEGPSRGPVWNLLGNDGDLQLQGPQFPVLGLLQDTPCGCRHPLPFPIKWHLNYFINNCGAIFLTAKKVNISESPVKFALQPDDILNGSKAPGKFPATLAAFKSIILCSFFLLNNISE